MTCSLWARAGCRGIWRWPSVPLMAENLDGGGSVSTPHGCGGRAQRPRCGPGWWALGRGQPNSRWGSPLRGAVVEPMLTKSALAVGDCLILTKGHRHRRAHGRSICRLGRVNSEWSSGGLALDGYLQRAPRLRVLRKLLCVRAATDVSGFGLLGHLGEMLRGFRRWAQSCNARRGFPCCLGAQRDACLAVLPARCKIVMNLASGRLSASRCQHQRMRRCRLLLDPQTSGGLLASVPSDACCRAVCRRNCVPWGLITPL